MKNSILISNIYLVAEFALIGLFLSILVRIVL
jgi:hypothetical protein